jgi:Phosphotransferase enzyme family
MASQEHLPACVRIRKRLGRKIHDPYSSSRAIPIGFGKIIKLRCNPAEVESIEYIRQHTSIPVPKIFRVYKYKLKGMGDCEDVIMQYVDGETLAAAWDKMTKASKEAVCKELAGYVEQMRKLKPPKEGFVGSVCLGTACDYRFGQDRFGPFESIKDFHAYNLRYDPLHAWEAEKEVVQVHSKSKSYTSKFTHGDLMPRNIMFKNGRITAIIDWENAGWFPEYWEYTKLHWQWRPYLVEYYKEMDSVMVTYPLELAAEEAIWKRYDWYAYEVPFAARCQQTE